MRETVELVQRFLVGDRTPYEGEVFRASEQAYLRFPVPGRRLPVLLGGWGEKTARLAGEIADVLKVGGTANPESVRWFKSRIEEGARAAKRDPAKIKLAFGSVTVVDRDRRLAESVARRHVAMYVGVAGRLDPVYSPTEDEMSAVESALAAGDEEAAGHALTSETLRRFAVFGTPDDVAARLEELFASGLDLFELGTPHGVEEVAAVGLLGEEVLSHF
jgi:5,10-methylenetetrahydromethanopterin reductase